MPLIFPENLDMSFCCILLLFKVVTAVSRITVNSGSFVQSVTYGSGLGGGLCWSSLSTSLLENSFG